MAHGPALAPLLAALLAIVAWCVPNHQVPWRAFHSDLVMAVAFGLAGIWACCKAGSRDTAVPTLSLVASGAALIPMIQFALGKLSFAGDMWIAALYLLGIALAIAMGFRLARSEGTSAVFGLFAHTVLWAGIVSVGLALYQWQRLEFLGAFASPMPDFGRAIANLNQPNHFATLLVMALCGVAWLHGERRVGTWVAALLVVYLGLGIAMAQSRIGYLSVTVLAAWLFLYRRLLGPHLAPRRVITAWLTIAACVVLWPSLARLGETAVSRAIVEVTSSGWRLVHWMSMIDAIAREPWTGYGWNQLAHAQAIVAPDHPRTGEILEHSHNLVLDLLIWNGAPLGLLLMLAFSTWAWSAARNVRNSTSTLALAALGVIFLHGLVEFPLEYAYFLLPAGLLMGIVSAEMGPSWSRRLPRLILPAATMVAVLLTAAVAADYLDVEEEWRLLRFEEARIGLDTPVPAPHGIGVLSQLHAFLSTSRKTPAADMSDEEIDAMRRVAERYPYSFTLLKYAAALALNGRPELARSALRPICQTHPESLCVSARARWSELSAKEPHIAAVPWP